jgi:hypothetical protein
MAVYGLLLVIALIALDWRLVASGNGVSQDAELVYCLAPAQTGNLVNAAVSLGLADQGSAPGRIRVAGRELTLTQWRATQNESFERACTALAAESTLSTSSAGTGDNGGQELIDVLLPVVAGALLTLVLDDAKRASDRRWALADELRANWTTFEASVLSYARDRASPPNSGRASLEEVNGNRRALQATLRKILSQRRKSPTLIALRDALNDALGTALPNGWGRSDDRDVNEVRSRREEEVKDCLKNSDTAVQKVASALDSRIWLPWKL